jgi:hypothetical protein
MDDLLLELESPIATGSSRMLEDLVAIERLEEVNVQRKRSEDKRWPFMHHVLLELESLSSRL